MAALPYFSFNEIVQVRSAARGELAVDRLPDATYEKIYRYFLESREMPYGTAKARTGDPYQWIGEKLDAMLLDGTLDNFLGV